MSYTPSSNYLTVRRLWDILSSFKTKIATALGGKQDTLTTQTAYTSKGSATKVPQITTNTLGQVTGITEVTISGVTPSAHAVSTTTYGVGSSSNYGHVKLATGNMDGASHEDGVAVSKNHTHDQYRNRWKDYSGFFNTTSATGAMWGKVATVTYPDGLDGNNVIYGRIWMHQYYNTELHADFYIFFPDGRTSACTGNFTTDNIGKIKVGYIIDTTNRTVDIYGYLNGYAYSGIKLEIDKVVRYHGTDVDATMTYYSGSSTTTTEPTGITYATNASDGTSGVANVANLVLDNGNIAGNTISMAYSGSAATQDNFKSLACFYDPPSGSPDENTGTYHLRDISLLNMHDLIGYGHVIIPCEVAATQSNFRWFARLKPYKANGVGMFNLRIDILNSNNPANTSTNESPTVRYSYFCQYKSYKNDNNQNWNFICHSVSGANTTSDSVDNFEPGMWWCADGDYRYFCVHTGSFGATVNVTLEHSSGLGSVFELELGDPSKTISGNVQGARRPWDTSVATATGTNPPIPSNITAIGTIPIHMMAYVEGRGASVSAVGSSSQPVYADKRGKLIAVNNKSTANNLLNSLDATTQQDITSDDVYIPTTSRDGTSTTTWYRRKITGLLTWIKTKMRSNVTVDYATRSWTALQYMGYSYTGYSDTWANSNSFDALSLKVGDIARLYVTITNMANAHFIVEIKVTALPSTSSGEITGTVQAAYQANQNEILENSDGSADANDFIIPGTYNLKKVIQITKHWPGQTSGNSDYTSLVVQRAVTTSATGSANYGTQYVSQEMYWQNKALWRVYPASGNWTDWRSIAYIPTAYTAIGSSNLPVYVDANGKVTAVTASSTGNNLLVSIGDGYDNIWNGDQLIASSHTNNTTDNTAYTHRSTDHLLNFLFRNGTGGYDYANLDSSMKTFGHAYGATIASDTGCYGWKIGTTQCNSGWTSASFKAIAVIWDFNSNHITTGYGARNFVGVLDIYHRMDAATVSDSAEKYVGMLTSIVPLPTIDSNDERGFAVFAERDTSTHTLTWYIGRNSGSGTMNRKLEYARMTIFPIQEFSFKKFLVQVNSTISAGNDWWGTRGSVAVKWDQYNAVGASNLPVYIDSNKQVQPVTASTTQGNFIRSVSAATTIGADEYIAAAGASSGQWRYTFSTVSDWILGNLIHERSPAATGVGTSTKRIQLGYGLKTGVGYCCYLVHIFFNSVAGAVLGKGVTLLVTYDWRQSGYQNAKCMILCDNGLDASGYRVVMANFETDNNTYLHLCLGLVKKSASTTLVSFEYSYCKMMRVADGVNWTESIASDTNASYDYIIASEFGTADNASTAAMASKLSTNAGSANQPVYFSNGVPVACSWWVS